MNTNVVHVRVDDRLVHGQVTVGWSRHVGAGQIVVANDEAASSPLRKNMLEMIPLAGIKISVLSIDGFMKADADAKFGSAKVFLVVGTPLDLLELVERGLAIDSAIVGNVGYREGRRRLTREVHADEGEVAAMRDLVNRGIALDAQWTPGSPKVDLKHELDKIG